MRPRWSLFFAISAGVPCARARALHATTENNTSAVSWDASNTQWSALIRTRLRGWTECLNESKMSFYRNIICGAVKVHKHFISISPLPQQPPSPFPSLIYKWTSQTCFSSKTQMSHVVVPFYTWIYWYTYYKTVLKELDNNSIFIALSSTIQYKYKKTRTEWFVDKLQFK